MLKTNLNTIKKNIKKLKHDPILHEAMKTLKNVYKCNNIYS